jgi:hypothetical protein
MSTRKPTLTTLLALAALTLSSTPAGAHPTRELTGTFGTIEEPNGGIAVDLETGDVYIANGKTDTINIYGATGGPPAGGIPSQITLPPKYLKYNSSGNSLNSVAVDNSCYEHVPRLTGKECEEYDPSYGDVYVTNNSIIIRGLAEFKLNGSEYEQVGEIPSPSERLLNGVTVDSRGGVYFTSPIGTDPYKGSVWVREASGEAVEIPQNIVPGPGDIAVDDAGDVYVGQVHEYGQKRPGTEEEDGVAKLKVGAAGEVLSEEVLAPPMVGVYRPVAVDRVTGDVYVGDGTDIAEYDAAGVLQLEFGSSEPSGGSLVGEKAVVAFAVNSATERVYVVNTARDDIDVFGPVLGPPSVASEQPGASDVTRTSALLAGTADPESGSGASYYYEYVAGGEYEPGAADPYGAGGRTASTALAGAHADETFERVVLTGLSPGTTYHYRVVVSNSSGTSYGPDQTLTTTPATPPLASTGPAGGVSATGVTLTGTVDPQGLPTSYVFEVGLDTGYGGARLYGNAGSSTGEVQVTVGLQYLIPGTTYHYRLAATSFDGTSYGQDMQFTTPGVPPTVVQPAGAPLIASPTVQFPSIAGAITEPQGHSKTKKARKRRKKAAGRTNSKTHRRAGKTNDSRRR